MMQQPMMMVGQPMVGQPMGQYQQPMQVVGYQLQPMVNPKLFDGRAMYFQCPTDNSQIPTAQFKFLHCARLVQRATREYVVNGHVDGWLTPRHLSPNIYSDYPAPRLPQLADHVNIFFCYTDYHALGCRLFAHYDMTRDNPEFRGHTTVMDTVEYLVELRVHKDITLAQLAAFIRDHTGQLGTEANGCCSGGGPCGGCCCLGYKSEKSPTLLVVSPGSPHEEDHDCAADSEKYAVPISQLGIGSGSRVAPSNEHVRRCCGGRTPMSWAWLVFLFWLCLLCLP